MRIKAELFEREGHVKYYAMVDGHFYFWVPCVNRWLPSSKSDREDVLNAYNQCKEDGSLRDVELKGYLSL